MIYTFTQLVRSTFSHTCWPKKTEGTSTDKTQAWNTIEVAQLFFFVREKKHRRGPPNHALRDPFFWKTQLLFFFLWCLPFFLANGKRTQVLGESKMAVVVKLGKSLSGQTTWKGCDRQTSVEYMWIPLDGPLFVVIHGVSRVLSLKWPVLHGKTGGDNCGVVINPI